MAGLGRRAVSLWRARRSSRSSDVDHDPGARLDVRRHHDPHAVLEHRRLVRRGRGLALDHRIGLHHREHGGLGQPRHQRPPLVGLHRQGHALLEERQAVGEQILIDRRLLEGLLVHQVELAARPRRGTGTLLLEANALDRLGGAEALVQLGAVDQIPELDLLIGGALARLHVLGSDHHPETIPVLEHVAGADRVAVDLHVRITWDRLRAATAAAVLDCAVCLAQRGRPGKAERPAPRSTTPTPARRAAGGPRRPASVGIGPQARVGGHEVGPRARQRRAVAPR